MVIVKLFGILNNSFKPIDNLLDLYFLFRWRCYVVYDLAKCHSISIILFSTVNETFTIPAHLNPCVKVFTNWATYMRLNLKRFRTFNNANLLTQWNLLKYLTHLISTRYFREPVGSINPYSHSQLSETFCLYLPK